MATRITVDTVEAAQSMKAFRQAITANTQAWKANEIALKNSGEYAKAAQEKVKGLTEVMRLQQERIAKLREQQEGLDRTNRADANTYISLQKQINAATRQLNSYAAQVERAKNNAAYHESGLAKLKEQYKANQAASSALADRLKAEGNVMERSNVRYKAARESLTNLQQQYRKQEDLLKQIETQSGKTSAAYQKQKVQLDRTGEAVAKAKDQVKDLGKEFNQLHPTGINRVDKSVNTLNRSLDKVKDKARSAFSSIKEHSVMAIAAFAGIGRAAYEGAVKATDLQDSYTKTTNLLVTGGEKAAEATRNVTKMQQQGRAMSVKYGVSQQEIANAYQELTKRGYTSSQSLGAMKTMLQASAASGEDLQDVVESSTAAIEAFGLKANGTSKMLANTKKAVNEMAYAADMTAADFKSMSVAMEYAGPQAKTLGYNVGEAASAIGILSDNGLEADKAGTGLRQVLNSLIAPTQGATEALKGIGLSTKDFTDQHGKMKPMEEIFRLLNEHTKNLNKQQKGALFQALFGSTGESAGIILADNAKKLDELNKKVQDSYKGQGYVQELANKNMGSAKMSMRQFKEAAEAVEVTMGQALLPALRDSAVAMAKAFESKDGQNALKELGKVIGNVARALANMIIWMTKHKTEVKIFGGVLIGAFAVFKTLTIANNIRRVVTELGLLTKAAKIGSGVIKGLGTAAKLGVGVIKGLGTAAKIAGIGLKGGLVVGGLLIVITTLVELYKHNKKVKAFFDGIAKAAKAGMKATVKWFSNGWKSIKKSIDDGIKKSQKSWNNFAKATSKVTSNLWKNTKKVFTNGWKNLQTYTRKGVNGVEKEHNQLTRLADRAARQLFKQNEATFRAGYKVIGDQTRTWRDLMSGHWDRLDNDTRQTARDMRNFQERLFSGLYDKLNDMTGGRLGEMLKTFQRIFGSIQDAVGNAVGAVHRRFVDLVNGVLRPFKTLISNIKGGINWILDKIGASKLGGDFSISFPSYANGTDDTHPGGFAKVNDAKTAHYREMYRLPNGKVGMFPAVRDMIVPLPKGTSILDGERSYKLATMLGMIPRYADGIGDFFAGLLSKAGAVADSILENVDKIIAHPVEFAKSVFDRFVNQSSPIKFAQALITNVPAYIAKQMGAWIKKQFEVLSNPGGAGVARWRPYIIRAFHQLGVDPAEWKVQKLLRQIDTESKGDPLAFQHGYVDANTGGNEARGLLQFAYSTWLADALPGHTDWRNGYNQILAAIHVLELGGEGGWGNVGNGHGWAMGGEIFKHGFYEIAEHDQPEMVVPLDPNKRGRANQLLGEIVTRFKAEDLANGRLGQEASGSNADLDALNRKFDLLLSMFKDLLQLSGNQIEAIKAQGTFDTQSFYKKQARDLRMQQLGLGRWLDDWATYLF